jgi:putative heme transporter
VRARRLLTQPSRSTPSPFRTAHADAVPALGPIRVRPRERSETRAGDAAEPGSGGLAGALSVRDLSACAVRRGCERSRISTFGESVSSSVPAPSAGTAMARWSAKAILITAGVFLVGGAFWYARAATVPLIVAALISTQLIPLVGWMTRKGVNRGIAIAITLLGVVAIGVGLAWLFTDSLFGDLGGVGASISEGANKIVNWLGDNDRWVKQHEEEIRAFLRGVLPALKDAARGLISGAIGTLSLAAEIVSSAVLTLVFILYLLTSGNQVWEWLKNRFAPARRDRVGAAGVAAWNAASGYIRGIALVSTIDTTVIGIGMLIIGTPHTGTLMLLTFISLFVPILGAWLSGIVIFLVTLGALGTGPAIAIALVILIAQQLDSMFVTPLVYEKTVNLHPIVTLGGVIIGSQLLGIVGAFLTVPMIAVGWAVWNTLEGTNQRAPATPAADP